MSSLITFYLKKKVISKKILYKYLLFFILIGFVMYADELMEILQQMRQTPVKLDESVLEYKDYFNDNEVVRYVAEDCSYTLVYEDTWRIYAKEDISEDVVFTICSSIENIPIYSVNDLYEVSVCHSRIQDSSLELVVYTVIYFLFISRSVSVVQDIIEEKLSGMTEMLLSCVVPVKHLMARVLTSWFALGMDGFVLFLSFVFWTIIRFGVYPQYEIKQWFANWIVLDRAQFDLGFVSIGSVVLLLNLFILQILIITYMSKAKSIEEASYMTMWIHLFPIVLYYASFYLYAINDCVLLLPIIQTIVLPLSINYERRITMPFIAGSIVSVIFLILVIYICNRMYRNRVLNIEKVTKLF